MAGRIRAIDAKGVAESRSGSGEVAVPDLIGAPRKRIAVHRVPFEEAQLDAFRVGGKQCEIDPRTVPVCAKRPGPAMSQGRGDG